MVLVAPRWVGAVSEGWWCASCVRLTNDQAWSGLGSGREVEPTTTLGGFGCGGLLCVFWDWMIIQRSD